MKYKNAIKNPIIRGTLILTLTGAITRLLGFYYRVFLSDLIGAKELGIYQLVFPVYVLAISFCCQGIQTALTKCISTLLASENHKKMKLCFLITLIISLLLSIMTCAGIYLYADFLSVHFVRNHDTAACIQIVSLGLPFVAIKCCIHGYCLGLKHSKIIALSQLIEQIFRIGGTYALAITLTDNMPKGAALAAAGIVCGEICSCIYSVGSILKHFKGAGSYYRQTCIAHPDQEKNVILTLYKDSLLLTGNRVCMTLLASFESVLIPSMLTLYNGNSDYSLELFGVLMGMALPFIMLPSTLTNSLSSMLLPAVSESKAGNQNAKLSAMMQTSMRFCLLLGIFSSILFMIYGKDLGVAVFSNRSAGTFIFMMSPLCPFIYISTTLSAILNGLNKTGINLIYHLLAVTIRICFILFIVPTCGMKGYLWGLLASYLILTLLLISTIRIDISFSLDYNKCILIPAILATITGALLYLAYNYICSLCIAPKLLWLFCILTVYACIYFPICLYNNKIVIGQIR